MRKLDWFLAAIMASFLLAVAAIETGNLAIGVVDFGVAHAGSAGEVAMTVTPASALPSFWSVMMPWIAPVVAVCAAARCGARTPCAASPEAARSAATSSLRVVIGVVLRPW